MGELTGPKSSASREGQCAKCGACAVVCPVFQVTGRESRSPRGRIHLLEKLSAAHSSPELADILSQCLLCGACLDACPRQVDSPGRILKARQELPLLAGGHPFLKLFTRKILAHQALLAGTVRAAGLFDRSLLANLPAESGLRLRLGLPLQKPTSDTAKKSSPDTATQSTPFRASYFSGCHAAHLNPAISKSMGRLAKKFLGSDLQRPEAQTCCGLASLTAGAGDEAKRLAQKNIKAFEDHDLPILTSCGSCYAHLIRYPEFFTIDDPWHERATAFSARVEEFSRFFDQALAPGNFNQASEVPTEIRVHYHDPCHLRFGPGITSEPRNLLARMPGVTLTELPGGPKCCGQGGLFHLAYPELSKKIGSLLTTEFTPLHAELVTSTCTGCLLQWQRLLHDHDLSAEVLHLAVLMDRRLG